MNAIYRINRSGNFKARFEIKAFKESYTMNKFLNSKYDNKWNECKGNMPVKSGIYVLIGTEFVNVKTLDSSVLAHV